MNLLKYKSTIINTSLYERKLLTIQINTHIESFAKLRIYQNIILQLAVKLCTTVLVHTYKLADVPTLSGLHNYCSTIIMTKTWIIQAWIYSFVGRDK